MKSKMYFKVLVIGLILVMSVAALSACGQNQGNANVTDQNADQTTKAASQEESSQSQLAPYELVYYYGGTALPDSEAVNQEMNKLLKERINASIKLNCVNWSEYTDKMNVMLAAGEQVDLCFTSYWANPFNKQVANGSYLALDELLSKYGADINSQMPEGWWAASTIKGKIYAVPNIQYAANTPGLYVRKDLAEKYSLDVSKIKCMSDIEPFLDTIKKNEKDIIPFELSKGKGLDDSLAKGFLVIETYGCLDLNSSDKFKVLSFYEQPFMKELWNTSFRFAQNGYFPTDAATKNDTEAERKANKFAVLLPGNVSPYNDYDYKAQYGVDVVPVTFGVALMDTSSITATMNAIPKSSKDPERAMMFLNLLYGDKQVYNTICNGIENVHYTKVSDNIANIPADSKYNASGSAWEFGNVFNGLTRYGDPIDKLQKQAEGNKTATVSVLMGFNFDPTPVKTELAQLDAARSEFIAGLYAGAMDPNVYIPKYIDKLKKAGIETYLAELQKQINDWKAANGK